MNKRLYKSDTLHLYIQYVAMHFYSVNKAESLSTVCSTWLFWWYGLRLLTEVCYMKKLNICIPV